MTAFWEITASAHPAFILADGTQVSYSKLAEDIAHFRDRLGEPGLIGIECPGDYRQYVAYLAAYQAGCPVVLMPDGQGAASVNLTLSYHYAPGSDQLTALQPETLPAFHPDLALLLSTSGSTGASKWVRLSYENIAANAASIAKYLELSPDDRAPMALPFQYSYGMSVVNSHLAARGTLVLTEGSVVDAGFWTLFENAGCTSLAGVPHSFDLMDQGQIKTEHLDQLRYITQAGGKLAPARVKAWAERGTREGWRFFVMYGQTEAGPRISYLPPEQAALHPQSIGQAIPGGTLWVSDDSGQALDDGTEGELIYQGPNVMMGYAWTDDDLALGAGDDILKTGDIARRMPGGLYEIVGRASRFVKLFGYRVSLDEVEKRLAEQGLEAVAGADGDRMVLLMTPPAEGDPEARRAAVMTDISNWLSIPTNAFEVDLIDAIPRQASGKIDHQSVKALIQGRASQATSKPKSFVQSLKDRLFGRPKTVRAVFARYFADADLTPDVSFNDLGGDSLSYLSVALELEEILPSLPDSWTTMTLTELDAMTGQRGLFASIDMPTFLRACAIMLIVSGHFNFFEYGGGGALALFAVVGWSFAIFILPQVLERGSLVPIGILAFRVAGLTFGYMALLALGTGYGEWPIFLFISNWISPDVEGGAWFIEVYLQLFVVMAALLILPGVRAGLMRAPFVWAAGSAAVFVTVAAASDALIDTHHLYRRLPHLMGWFFLLGLAVPFAETRLQKIVLSLIALAGLWQFHEYSGLKPDFTLLALGLLIWIPALPIPRIALKPLRMIAAASLFIYLTHFQFRKISDALMFESPALAWATAILGGIILWRLYDPIDMWISRKLQAWTAPDTPKDRRAK